MFEFVFSLQLWRAGLQIKGEKRRIKKKKGVDRMKKTALVLEGGAMRGVYTAGVLDVFAENALLFPYVIGISAGALNALSYLSGQPGRNLKVTMEYAGDPRYFGVQRFIKDRNYFNFDFLFGQPLLNRPTNRQIAVHWVVRTGLISHAIGLHAALDQFRQNFCGIA